MSASFSQKLDKINYAYQIFRSKIRLIHDPKNLKEEFSMMPEVCDLIKKQKNIEFDEIAQKKIILNKNLDFCLEKVSEIIQKFKYKKINENKIEILFDSENDLKKFILENKIKENIFEFDLNFVSLIEIDYLKNLENVFIFGPCMITEYDLKEKLLKINSNIKIEKTICNLNYRFTDFFIIKFPDSKTSNLIRIFLQDLKVMWNDIKFHRILDYIDILHLNGFYPGKFLICDPVYISKNKSRIVQILNIFLPYMVTKEKILEIENYIRNFNFEGINIYSIFNENHPRRSDGKIFIECPNIFVSIKVFAMIGGLKINERPIITTFYPEILFKAKIFDLI